MRKHQVFAMDTCFHNSIVGTYPYDVRCEMLVELGFDAIYVSLQTDGLHHADRMAATKNQYGLEVVAAYAGLDVIAAKDDPKNHEVSELFQPLPYGCDLELTLITSGQSVKPSSIDIDHLAIERLKPLLEVAEKQQAHVCLYPHFGAWLECVEDGIRLCENMEHPALKLVFCGFHWYAVEGSNLSQSISSAIPYLHSVNICGSSRGVTLQVVRSNLLTVVTWTIFLCLVVFTAVDIQDLLVFKDTVLVEMSTPISSVQ